MQTAKFHDVSQANTCESLEIKMKYTCFANNCVEQTSHKVGNICSFINRVFSLLIVQRLMSFRLSHCTVVEGKLKKSSINYINKNSQQIILIVLACQALCVCLCVLCTARMKFRVLYRLVSILCWPHRQIE